MKFLKEARDLLSQANPSGDLAVVVERALELLIQKLRARRFGPTSARNARRVSEMPAGARPSESETAADAAPPASETAAGAPPPGSEMPAGAPRKRRRIRQGVRRQVAERDAERCCHVGPGGKRCEARAFLELHHVRPWALGGEDSVDNLSLRCRAHNRLLAELELGAAQVEQAIERRRKQRDRQRRCDE